MNELAQSASKHGRVRSILCTGATGLIGQRLIPAWLEAGHTVTVVSRRPEVATRLGSPLTVVTSLDELDGSEGIDAVVHLAGEPVAGKRWSSTRKQYLLDSRAALPEALGRWLKRTQQVPEVWLNASAIGFYGIRANPDEAFVETDEVGEGFAAELCSHIEHSASKHAGSARLVNLRIGLVLATPGGYLAALLPALKLWCGVILGNGQQWQSWIHRDDVVRAIDQCLRDTELVGPVNLVAPEPVRAKTLMQTLGKKLRRPAFLHLPAFALRLGFGEMADELLLGSQRVSPQALSHAGFEFRYATLNSALDDLFPDA